MMAPLTEIALFRLEPMPDEFPQARVIAEERPTDTVLEGHVLEAQYHCALGFLLLTSDDNPYEEALHIRLLDLHFQVIDAVDLRQIYHPAMLRNLQVIGHNSLMFSFFGDDCWRLDIDVQARIRWDVHLFASVSYPGRRLRSHYLGLVRANRDNGSPARL
jgi:hypothetical protein